MRISDNSNLKITSGILFFIGLIILYKTARIYNTLPFLIIFLNFLTGLLYIFISGTIWFQEKNLYLYRFISVVLLFLFEMILYILIKTNMLNKSMINIFYPTFATIYSMLISILLLYLSLIYDLPFIRKKR